MRLLNESHNPFVPIRDLELLHERKNYAASHLITFPLNQKSFNYIPFLWNLNQNPRKSAFPLKQAQLFTLQ
jgi:hypothetical protein